jgi:hypothetical protein
MALSVEQWLSEHGGPRRFERSASGDRMVVQRFLVERGCDLRPIYGVWMLKDQRGRRRRVRWQDVIAFVDGLRVAEGREPIRAQSRDAA